MARTSPLISIPSSGQDSALMRPGRLDRILYVGPPDFAGRIDILRIRTHKMSVDPSLDLAELAALVRQTLPSSLSQLGPFSQFDRIDEWVFGCRNYGNVPGSRLNRYARRRQHPICELYVLCQWHIVF